MTCVNCTPTKVSALMMVDCDGLTVKDLLVRVQLGNKTFNVIKMVDVEELKVYSESGRFFFIHSL